MKQALLLGLFCHSGLQVGVQVVCFLEFGGKAAAGDEEERYREDAGDDGRDMKLQPDRAGRNHTMAGEDVEILEHRSEHPSNGKRVPLDGGQFRVLLDADDLTGVENGEIQDLPEKVVPEAGFADGEKYGCADDIAQDGMAEKSYGKEPPHHLIVEPRRQNEINQPEHIAGNDKIVQCFKQRILSADEQSDAKRILRAQQHAGGVEREPEQVLFAALPGVQQCRKQHDAQADTGDHKAADDLTADTGTDGGQRPKVKAAPVAVQRFSAAANLDLVPAIRRRSVLKLEQPQLAVPQVVPGRAVDKQSAAARFWQKKAAAVLPFQREIQALAAQLVLFQGTALQQHKLVRQGSLRGKRVHIHPGRSGVDAQQRAEKQQHQQGNEHTVPELVFFHSLTSASSIPHFAPKANPQGTLIEI